MRWRLRHAPGAPLGGPQPTHTSPALPPPPAQTKLQAGAITPEAQVKLQVLASQCVAYEFVSAQRTQTELASIDWDRSKDWQKGVRNLVTLALVKSNRGR